MRDQARPEPRPPGRSLPRLGYWTERVLVVVVVTLFYNLYFLVSQRSLDLPAHHLDLAIDRSWPLVPGWMYVYAAVFITGFLPALVVRDRWLFRRVAIAYSIVQGCSFAVFLTFPVHMHLRALDTAVTNFPTWGLRLTYFLDTEAACFPSLHVTMATLAALCCLKVDKPVAALSGLLALGIALSTLFVKQHYLVDVLAGFVLASLVWAVVVAPFSLQHQPADRRHLPRWSAALIFFPYLSFVAALLVGYLVDFRPWEG